MNADMLRRAAAVMRERAEAAAPGPWEPPIGSGDVGYVWQRQGPMEAVRIAEATSDETAAHIASWHPDVAVVFADWLDNTAAEFDDVMSGSTETYAAFGPAVDAARAYLKETS